MLVNFVVESLEVIDQHRQTYLRDILPKLKSHCRDPCNFKRFDVKRVWQIHNNEYLNEVRHECTFKSHKNNIVYCWINICILFFKTFIFSGLVILLFRHILVNKVFWCKSTQNKIYNIVYKHTILYINKQDCIQTNKIVYKHIRL